MDEAETQANLERAMGLEPGELSPAGGGGEKPKPKEPAPEVRDEEPEEVEDDLDDGDDEDTDEETTSEDEDEGDEPDASKGPELPYDQRMSIKAALAGDGLPEALIESLSPDQLQAYWAKRQQRDEAFTGMKEDLRRLKSSGAGKDEDAKEGGAPTKEPDNPLPAADLSALADEFGEEEAQKIAGYVGAVTRPLLEAIGQMIDEQQRSRLAGMVPDGLSDEVYEKVLTRVIELGNTSMYSDLGGRARQNALFDAALRLEAPEAQAPPPGTKRNDKRDAKRRNGLPSRAGRGPRSPDKLTPDERMSAIALAAAEGKTAAEIQAMYG